MLSYELRNFFQRIGKTPEDSLITKAYYYLSASKIEGRDDKSGGDETARCDKKTETEHLTEFASANNLWFDNIAFYSYLAEGAEQKVFFNASEAVVTKLNDAIFYENWTDYLISLLIHNALFEATRYDLIGFVKINQVLYAAVNQNYIEPDEPTNLALVQKFMMANGFVVKKNNDYFSHELGLIVEDLHEENVLTQKNTLFFIDTVNYLVNRK